VGRLKKKLSLGVKTALLIVTAYAILASVAVTVTYSVYVEDIDNHYMALARNIAWTATHFMDGDRVSLYAETLEKDADYERMLNALFRIKHANNVASLYVGVVRGENMVCVMDAEDNSKTSRPLGHVEPLAEAMVRALGHLGDGVPPFISNSAFGWMASAYAPVFNSAGEVSAIVGADISMNEIMRRRHSYLAKFLLIMLIAVAFTAAVFLKLTKRFIVAPINALAAAATSFVSVGRRKDSEGLAVSAISSLDIHTGDEIESLGAAMQSMSKDIVEYIANLASITAERERANAELNVARQIQASILPHIFPPFLKFPDVEIYASMNPARDVGGDFYDFFVVDSDSIAVVIADVSGKGVPAALFMMMARTLIKHQILAGDPPHMVFESVNNQLCQNNETSMFVTVFLGVYNRTSNFLAYVNAGHNPPILMREDNSIDWLPVDKNFVLAGMEGIKFSPQEIEFREHDNLILYTDGVTEAMNERNELFSAARLLRLMSGLPEENRGARGIVEKINSEVGIFAGSAEQSDDITVLALRRRALED
jgi:sigma-B regulation protein RsbU (phosphoserine phosphatase)